jgi:FixJ family two-component response regulator
MKRSESLVAFGQPQPTSFPYVIDDDADTRQFLADILGTLGWWVETYASAEVFISAHTTMDSAGLLVDVKLPGMSGIEFLKARPVDLNQLPAIVLTGFGGVVLALKGMRAGAGDFDPLEQVGGSWLGASLVLPVVRLSLVGRQMIPQAWFM